MNKGFVFGKFMPFHKGHEAMIRFALTHCDFLTVLVCCSDREMIDCDIRKQWLEKTFDGEESIEIRTFLYKEDELPNSSVSSEDISRIWADVFLSLLPGYSILITSEPYGDFVAAFMNIRHIAFNKEKKEFPVSASVIQSDPFANWKFLPQSVKPFYAFKVVLLGTESTGKTTLATQLATYFEATLVSEAGRDIISDSTDFQFTDLYLVAEEHAKRIHRSEYGNAPLLIIDTDIHITKSYARFMFGKELMVSDPVYEANKADLYIYLTADAPYIQDGTRLAEDDRNNLDKSHRHTLLTHHISFTEIGGSWQERFEKAVALIQETIRTKAFIYRK